MDRANSVIFAPYYGGVNGKRVLRPRSPHFSVENPRTPRRILELRTSYCQVGCLSPRGKKTPWKSVVKVEEVSFPQESRFNGGLHARFDDQLHRGRQLAQPA